MTPRLGKLDTIWLATPDVTRLAGFYRDVLGFPVVQIMPDWAAIRLEGVTIGLHRGDPVQTLSGWVPCFQCESLEQLRLTLTEAGGEVRQELHETPRGWILDFQDPDGHRLQAIQLGTDDLRQP